MTPQEIFNFSVNHMRKQGVRAYRGKIDLCSYRTPEGLSCAVGCFINDDKLAKEMDNLKGPNNIDSIINTPDLGRKLPDWMRDNVNLLQDLQHLHDLYLGTDQFEGEVRSIAVFHGLEVPK